MSQCIAVKTMGCNLTGKGMQKECCFLKSFYIWGQSDGSLGRGACEHVVPGTHILLEGGNPQASDAKVGRSFVLLLITLLPSDPIDHVG